MPALHLKLAGSLVAGGLAGVAALVTMTSTSSPQLMPTGDTTSTTTTQTVVDTPAPCPTGTVERDDACEKVVKVVEPAQPVAVQQDAQEQPETEPTDAPTQAAVAPQPVAPVAPATQPQVTRSEDGHESDATEVEHKDDQPDSETHSQESGD